MRTLTLTLLCAASLTLACAEHEGGPTIEPRSGTWEFVGSDPVNDTCGYPGLYVDPAGDFELDNNGDGTFTVTAGDNVFECALNGSSFSCPERFTGENDIGAAAGLDAVVIYNISVSGSLSSATAMSGRQSFRIVCEGADCPAVEATVGVTTPCGWEQSFTATFAD